jgi:ABC-type anion transport system duplicated permease subunit
MDQPAQVFTVPQPVERGFQRGDLVVLLGVVVLIYAGVSLAVHTPLALRGPDISLAPEVLPYYAVRSVGRMAAAYFLSLLVALLYGRAAAEHRQAEQVLLPLLDVLQSVPILSFLPVVLLSLSAVLPPRLAAELAAIVLIFTSQAWNLIFAWYQSLKTIPAELREAAAIFRFNGWWRFRTLELPFAAISLLWNSMMSWAGGWFFLMAAEIFTVGERDFRLPGLGAYLQEAATRGDMAAIAWGLATLVAVIVVLDQLVWRPLRVVAALVMALAWTLPLRVAIGTRPHLAARVQPLAQIAASIPATALFPVVVLVIAGLPAGMNLAAVLLMLMGTQWYLLFNVIAGASAIPQDLQYTAGLLQLSRWQRWRILILPALFPYLITGAVTASGGAWNASIVAEYSDFAGQPRYVIGVGSLIAQATASGTYPLLLAATLGMIGSVVTINRLVWRRLYRVAEERYRLE